MCEEQTSRRSTPGRATGAFTQPDFSGATAGKAMLILTRRPGEALYLGDDIRITVLGVQGKQIKLGLEVPKDMTVYREEIYLRVQEQNQLALASKDEDLLAATQLWHGTKKK